MGKCKKTFTMGITMWCSGKLVALFVGIINADCIAKIMVYCMFDGQFINYCVPLISTRRLSINSLPGSIVVDFIE